MTLTNARESSSVDTLPVAPVARALATHWRALVGATTVAFAITAGLIMLLPTKCEATVSVSTVGSARGATLGQGISAAFLSAMSTGLQATPALVGELLNSHAVASAVSRTTPPGRRGRLVGELLEPSLGEHPTEEELRRAVARVVSTRVDRETGLISLSVISSDSALARFIVLQLVDETTALFRAASHVQAREVHVALEARVDSAQRQMINAENALLRFASSNRSATVFSRAAVEEQRLQRQVTLSQAILLQALQDRESAIAKELEETPVLVTVEPLPSELPPVRRGTFIWASFVSVLALAFSASWAVRKQMKSEMAVALPSGL